MGDLTENFSEYEFECPCCGLFNVSHLLVAILQNIRDELGVRLDVSSGCRCEKHNKLIGGSKNSSHLCSESKKGLAADISVPTDIGFYGLIRAGVNRFDRIGVYPGKNFVHFDVDDSKDRNVIWFG